jgi:hypothetical protein
VQNACEYARQYNLSTNDTATLEPSGDLAEIGAALRDDLRRQDIRGAAQLFRAGGVRFDLAPALTLRDPRSAANRRLP